MKKLKLAWIDKYRTDILFALGIFFGVCSYMFPNLVIKLFSWFMLAGIIYEIYVEAKKK